MKILISKPSNEKKFQISGIKNIIISGIAALLSFYALTIVAQRFGGSAGSDAYFFLLSLTTLFTGLIGAIFSVVLLPIFVELRIRSGKNAASLFASSIFSWCLLLILPITWLSYSHYEFFYELFSKFNYSEIVDNRFVLIYFAPIFAVAIFSEFFRTIASALGEYSLAALCALFQPLFLLVELLKFSPALREDAMAISLLVAKITILIFMLMVVVFRNKINISLNFKKNPNTKKFMRKAFPYWSANLVTSFSTFFFDYMASGLGVGVLTALGYAQRIFAIPATLLLNPILEIARTKFSESQAINDAKAFSHTYDKLIKFVIYLTIPIAFFYYFFANEIVSILFQRGAFNVNNVNIAAECLKILAISIPFSSMFIVNGRACESFQRLIWPSFFGAIGNIMMMYFTYILINRFGYIGIPYARLAVDVLYFFPFGFIAFYLFYGKFDFRYTFKKIFIVTLCSIIGISTLHFLLF